MYEPLLIFRPEFFCRFTYRFAMRKLVFTDSEWLHPTKQLSTKIESKLIMILQEWTDFLMNIYKKQQMNGWIENSSNVFKTYVQFDWTFHFSQKLKFHSFMLWRINPFFMIIHLIICGSLLISSSYFSGLPYHISLVVFALRAHHLNFFQVILCTICVTVILYDISNVVGTPKR